MPAAHLAGAATAAPATAPESTTPARPGGRLAFVYLLNVVSSLAVVYLHVSLEVFDPQHAGQWPLALALQAGCIFAVPVFFMVSGMNLIGYRDRYSTATFVRKRVARVGVALVASSLVCYLLFALLPDYFWGAERIATTASPLDFLYRLLSNQINDVYWFLYAIIALYVLTPLISLAAHRRRVLEYIIACCLVVSVTLPLAKRLGVPPETLDNLLGWPLFSDVWLLYYLLGYYLAQYVLPNVRSKGLLGAGALVAYVASAIGMYELGLVTNGLPPIPPVPGASSHLVGLLPQAYDSYAASTTDPLCVVEAVSVFVLGASLEGWLQRHAGLTNKLLRTMSGAALGVYLFHIPLIYWISRAAERGIRGFGWLQRHMLVRGLVVYAVTMAWVVAVRAVRTAIGRARR